MLRVTCNGHYKRIKLALLAASTIERDCLRKIFESEPNISIIGEKESADELHLMVGDHLPDIIVTGTYLTNPEAGAYLNEVKRLQKIFPQAPILVLIDQEEQYIELQSLESEYIGIIEKRQSVQILLQAVRQIPQDKDWSYQRLTARFLRSRRFDFIKDNLRAGNGEQIKIATLTRRELEVIKILCHGLSNKEISRELSISEATVRHHLSSIYSKLYTQDRLNLIIYAYQHRILNGDDEKYKNWQKTIQSIKETPKQHFALR